MSQEIRLIITQACNFNCYFCHREGISQNKKTLLDVDDICYIYENANKKLGFDTMTISGGEPLLVKNIVDIARSLYERGCKTTIVTNGSLLNKNFEIGKYISKINISLHTLEEKEYEKIVGKEDQFNVVINNIKEFRKMYPNIEINLNYALIKKENLIDELNQIIGFATENKLNIKFIELFPKGKENFVPLEFLHEYLVETGFVNADLDTRKDKFVNQNNCTVYTTKCLCSKAMDYDYPSDFCNKNNDLFLTQDGVINLCRETEEAISIFEEVKNRQEDLLQKKLVKSLSSLGTNCICEKMKK